MSHFYGKIQGTKGEATRCGAKSSGLETIAASWRGAVNTTLYHDEDTGVDMAVVALTKWHSVGTYRELYRGPVNPDDQAKIDAHAARTKDQANPLTADKPPGVEPRGPGEELPTRRRVPLDDRARANQELSDRRLGDLDSWPDESIAQGLGVNQ